MVLSMERWGGKNCVVTGASEGIGATLAIGLVQQGMIVIGLARRPNLIENLRKQLPNELQSKLHALKCDMTDEDDILNAFKWIESNLGCISVLINNAAVSYNDKMSEAKTSNWRAMLETNVLGLSIATRQALQSMQRHQCEGHIIHINSILGHYVAFVPNINMYSACKHAVTALTEALRQELLQKENKIRVTSVSPGPVATKFIQDIEVDKSNFPTLNTDDVLDAVVYVLSTPQHVQVQDILFRPLGEPV